MAIIETQNLTYLYGKNTPFQIAAINDINCSIDEGELVGIIGHTGSGKSTLVQHLNGLIKPESGKIFIDGQDIWDKNTNIKEIRFKVGLCFQYPEYQLFEETVYKDIAFGPRNMKLDKNEIDNRVREAISYVGIDESFLEKSPFDLSGGEKRRVAIAGVMAMKPKILILDEPTAGLDPKGRDTILEMILNYRNQTGSTVLIVSHSMEDVAKIATKVLVMNKSRLETYGTVEEVYSHLDNLVNMGLNVPQVTRIFIELRKRGVNVSEKIFTVEQGIEEIRRLVSKGGGV